MTVRRVVLAAVFAACAVPATAAAPVDTLKERQARVDSILASNPREMPPAERQRLGQALAEAFDFTAMSKAALADWERRPEAERTQFAQAFERLVRASLIRRVNIYRVEKVDYTREDQKGETALVETTVTSRDATTDVAYSFVRTANGWRISDYAIDGVSTARNYRSQFTRIVEKNGWLALLERIRKRAEALEKDAAEEDE
jgi:phospholipid transport system substrate-binding protein